MSNPTIIQRWLAILNKHEHEPNVQLTEKETETLHAFIKASVQLLEAESKRVAQLAQEQKPHERR